MVAFFTDPVPRMYISIVSTRQHTPLLISSFLSGTNLSPPIVPAVPLHSTHGTSKMVGQQRLN